VFVDLIIQHAMRMCRIILSSLACLPVPYFSILSHKRRDVRESVFEHKMCVLISSANLSETFLILRRNERDVIKNVDDLHRKYSLFLSEFNERLILSTYFRKMLKY
jgi:hypothetical protein